MTEAETIELVAILGSNTFTTFSVYLSITFAYLTVAYFVGKSLTRFQVITISGLYVASAGASSIACVASTKVWTDLIATYPSIVNQSRIYGLGVWDNYMVLLLFAGMLVALHFMYNARQTAKAVTSG